MILPKNAYEFQSAQDIRNAWYDAATQLSIRTGVYIETLVEYENIYPTQRIKRIYFKVFDHECEGLAQVEKFIANKAFL
jgi:hypothetical protein